MNVGELYALASRSPEQAHNFVTSLVEEIINRKIESLAESQHLTDSFGKAHYQSLSDLATKANENSQSYSKLGYPAKSPASIQSLFRKGTFGVSNNEKQHRVNNSLGQKHFEYGDAPAGSTYLQSPNPERASTELPLRFKSPQLCKYCRQTMNVSTCDGIDLETSKQPRIRNMGFYSYNFVYAVVTPPSAQKQAQPRYSKAQQPLKNSAMQSFDFDLTVSQAPKESQVIQAKERQFSELCLSNPPPVIPEKPIPPYFSNSNQSIIEMGVDQSQRSLGEPAESTSPKTYFQSKFEQDKPKSNQKQIEQNLAMISNLIVPDGQLQLHQRSSIQRDLLSEPHELVNDTLYRRFMQEPSPHTPLTKLLDHLDVSDIMQGSGSSSPSTTFQLNLMKEFDRERIQRTPVQQQQQQQIQFTPTQNPQKLMNRVYDQIEKLKSTTSKNKENKPNRPPSTRKNQPQPARKPAQTIYQQVLNSKKK